VDISRPGLSIQTITAACLSVALTLAGCGGPARNAYKRGEACRERGDDAGALHAYEEAIRLDPAYAKAYWSRAFVYQDKGEFDKAVADLTEVVRLRPDFAPGYRARGLAYGETRTRLPSRSDQGPDIRSKAEADFQKAHQLDPTCCYRNQENTAWVADHAATKGQEP